MRHVRPNRRVASAAVRATSSNVPPPRGNTLCSFHAWLVEGPANPCCGSASSAATRWSNHPGPTSTPLSNRTNRSASSARTKRLKHAAAPCGGVVADCGRSDSVSSTFCVGASAPSGRSRSPCAEDVCDCRLASVARNRSGSECTEMPMQIRFMALTKKVQRKRQASP